MDKKITFIFYLICFSKCIAGDEVVTSHCGTPGSPAHGRVNLIKDMINIGVAAVYECDAGYELIGSHSRLCQENGTWSATMPFCVIDVALNKPSNSSSTKGSSGPNKANDGNLLNKENDCFQSKNEFSPWWQINLLKPYEIIGLRITTRDCCDTDQHAIEIRIGNTSHLMENRLCSWLPTGLAMGGIQDINCHQPTIGQYVTIQMAGVEGSLSFCEVSILTTSEISPHYCYQDNSKAMAKAFNNKCYEFQHQVGKSAKDAEKYCKNHSGSLVAPIDLAKQSFFESELRSTLNTSLKFWIGLKKDKLNNWKWTNGSPLTESFWSSGQPNNDNTGEVCVTLDGNLNWKWNDINCKVDFMRVICQYDPLTCGSPDVHPNATLIGSDFDIGKKIQYRCNNGSKLIGHIERVCQKSGLWSNKAPTCKFIDCGLPSVQNGNISFLDNTTYYRSRAEYKCLSNNNIIGNKIRVCLESGLWSGEEPLCMDRECNQLKEITNGNFSLINGKFGIGSQIQYFCNDDYILVGNDKRICLKNGTWDGKEPICQEKICKQPEPIENGFVNVTGFDSESKAVYYCQKGYTLNGNSERICMQTHKWSNTTPSCSVIKCGSPPPLDNGNYQADNNYNYGNSVKYFCIDGYHLEGQGTLSCSVNSSWVPEPPRCVLKKCEKLVMNEYQQMEGNSQDVGSQITFSCVDGYILYGNKTLKCLKNGFWSNTVPVCKPVECSVPLVSSNLTVTLIDIPPVYKTVATFSCPLPYRVNGSMTSVCQKDGAWSNKIPNCIAVECSIPIVSNNLNVTLNNTSPIYETVATYSCPMGYQINGFSSSICQKDGTWSNETPNCTVIECLSLNISNGIVTISQSPAIYNSFATYSCLQSYYLVGPQMRYCTINGTWSDLEPQCISKGCDHPGEIVNGFIVGNSFHENHTIEYFCELGFYAQGNTSRTCLHNGSWSGETPKCIAHDCELPKSIPYGIVQILENPPVYKSLVYYECLENYKLVGVHVRMCTSRGVWNASEPTCIPAICNKPIIENGYVNVSQSILGVNTLANYNCNEGYTLIGPSTRMCLENLLWSDEQPKCKEKLCPQPKKNPHVIVSTNQLSIGSFLNYSCEEGYSIAGLLIRKCLSSAEWEGSEPSCEPVDCGTPAPIPNSKIVFINGTTFGSIAEHACDEKFILDGEKIRTCLSNGTWNGYQTKCIDIQSISCLMPYKQAHMTIVGNNSIINSTIEYFCDSGYKLQGSNKRTCLDTIEWSGKTPECKPIDCGAPDVPFNGGVILDNQTTTFKSHLQYTCNKPYVLIGVIWSSCMESGKWSGVPPECKFLTSDNPSSNEISLTETLKASLINDENSLTEDETTFLEKPIQRKYNLQLGLGVGFSVSFLLLMAVGVLIFFIIKAKRKLDRNRQPIPLQPLNKEKPVVFYQFQRPRGLETIA